MGTYFHIREVQREKQNGLGWSHLRDLGCEKWSGTKKTATFANRQIDKTYPTWDPPLPKSPNMAKIDQTQFFCKIWTLTMILVWSSPNLVGWSFFGRFLKLAAHLGLKVPIYGTIFHSLYLKDEPIPGHSAFRIELP